MRNLHAIKTETGVAIVDRQPGPYSWAPPVDTVVLDLTQDEANQLDADLTPPPPTKKDS